VIGLRSLQILINSITQNDGDFMMNEEEIDIENKQSDILTSPVFIVGSGRSGTTWLQRLLVSNPQIAGGQESEFFLYFGACLRAVKHDDTAARKLGLPAYWNEPDLYESILDLWKKTFSSMLKMKPEATLLAEKTPAHAFYMDLIVKMLPDAKFIHIIRDSRAVVSSMIAAEKGWGKSWAPNSIKEASIIWWQSVNRVKKSGQQISSERYLEVHYEDLLVNTHYELSRIYDYLNIDYDSEMLESIIEEQSIKKQRAVGGTAFKDHNGNDLKEPDGFFRKGKADSWKQELNIYQKLVVWRYTRKLMRECGYDWSGRIKANKEQYDE